MIYLPYDRYLNKEKLTIYIDGEEISIYNISEEIIDISISRLKNRTNLNRSRDFISIDSSWLRVFKCLKNDIRKEKLMKINENR